MKTRRRGARSRTCHGAKFARLAGACLLFVALPLAACGSVTRGGEAAGFVGWDWQVVTVSYNGSATSIPTSQHVFLGFSPNGHFAADDGVNYQSGGVFRATRDGFTVSDMGATAAGYAGHDPAVLLAMRAIGSFDDEGVHATATLTGYRLVVEVGSYTLICQRSGQQADPSPIPV
jgi:hypothetical protein